jgi:hypothetical protein
VSELNGSSSTTSTGAGVSSFPLLELSERLQTHEPCWVCPAPGLGLCGDRCLDATGSLRCANMGGDDSTIASVTQTFPPTSSPRLIAAAARSR